MAQQETVAMFRLTPVGEATEKIFFIRGRWQSLAFSVAVSDGVSVWSQEFDRDMVSSLLCLNHAILPPDRYVTHAKEALSSQYSGADPKFTYSIETTADGGMELVWNIVGTIALECRVHLPLSTGPGGALDIMQGLLMERDNVAILMKHERKKKETAEATLAQAQAFIESVSGVKAQVEEDLYAKFVAVLNRKKQRIRELRKDLGAANAEIDALRAKLKRASRNQPTVADDDGGEADGGEASPTGVARKVSSKGKRRAETGGGDTDDETNDGSASGGGAVGPDTAFTGEGASYLSALLGTSVAPPANSDASVTAGSGSAAGSKNVRPLTKRRKRRRADTDSAPEPLSATGSGASAAAARAPGNLHTSGPVSGEPGAKRRKKPAASPTPSAGDFIEKM